MSSTSANEIVHALPHNPVHLFQRNTAPGAYDNPMGCGAFSTTMAMSFYNPQQFGTYAMAQEVFGEMIKVPFLGGTFENQNARVAGKHGFVAADYDFGTVEDLAAVIDSGAPAVLLINPNRFRIGQHDVLLVGYSTDAQGHYLNLFIDNPWDESATQPAPPGLTYPGNTFIPVADLHQRWTGIFTPIWAAPAAANQWRARMHRG